MKHFIKDFADTMAAAAMAQGGDHKAAKEIMDEARQIREMKKAVKVHKERVQNIIEKHDRTEEAIVFAQAGEQAVAQDILKEAKQEKKKILVVGGEDGFSEKLIDYAVGMAGRMHYEIVALNVIPVGKQLFRFLNEKKVTEEFQQKPEKGAISFQKAAETRKLPFRHMVKFGSFDRVVKEIHREIHRVSFVLTEPDHLCEGASDCKVTSIPVFCMVPDAQ